MTKHLQHVIQAILFVICLIAKKKKKKDLVKTTDHHDAGKRRKGYKLIVQRLLVDC